MREWFREGWRVRVDHQAAEIVPANGAMRAVAVPRGNHTITIRYRLMSFYLGAALTLLGVVGALLIARLRLTAKV